MHTHCQHVNFIKMQLNVSHVHALVSCFPGLRLNYIRFSRPVRVTGSCSCKSCWPQDTTAQQKVPVDACPLAQVQEPCRDDHLLPGVQVTVGAPAVLGAHPLLQMAVQGAPGWAPSQRSLGQVLLGAVGRLTPVQPGMKRQTAAVANILTWQMTT